MKKYSVLALFVTVLFNMIGITSCDTTGDIVESEPSRDCIITSATLGTLRRTVETKDTTYQYSVTGGAYLLYIDQVNYKVYNPDSLPTGTHAEKLVFASNGIVHSGTIAIQSLTTKQDTAFVPTDSTDFSVPRLVTVYAEDGQSKRTYTFDIRVHKQEGDTIEWKQLMHNPLSPLASFVAHRTIEADSTLYIFGERADGQRQVVTSDILHPDFNDAANISTSFSEPIKVSSIQHFGDSFYALAGNKLVTSALAEGTWTEVETAIHLDALAGVSGDSLYAISNNEMVATADGKTWHVSSMDKDDNLPTSNMTFAVQPAADNNGVSTTLFVGENNGDMKVWKHDVSVLGGYCCPWTSLPQSSELKNYACPNLKNAQLFAYDSKMVLVGIDSDNKVTPFYTSQDNGRTWKTGVLHQPSASGVTALSVACDEMQCIWIICSGTGDIYRGRLNRLAWENNQTRFE